MTRRFMHRSSYVTGLLLWLAGGLGMAHAGALTVGDILVSDENSPGRIREFTPTGTLVQTFNFSGTDFPPRAITVDSSGNIQIYNGTFNPTLTTLNPLTGLVTHNTSFPGWSTVNDTIYGGLVAFGNYVFATDMATGSGGGPNGIVRFNINDYSATRFGSGPVNGSGDNIQLALGQNGLLYAEYPGLSPGGNKLDVYDPTTLAHLNTINLGFLDVHSIAVDKNGDIFAVDAYQNIDEFAPDGTLLRSLPTGFGGSEIEIDPSGRLAVSAFGYLLFSDTSLSSFSTLNVGTTSPEEVNFIAYVEPPLAPAPEPSSLALLTVAAVGGAGFAWRKRRRCGAKSGRGRALLGS